MCANHKKYELTLNKVPNKSLKIEYRVTFRISCPLQKEDDLATITKQTLHCILPDPTSVILTTLCAEVHLSTGTKVFIPIPLLATLPFPASIS